VDGKLIWIFCLTIATLANGIVTLIKRKNNPGNYGERIATLEEAVKELKEDVKWIRDKINGMRK